MEMPASQLHEERMNAWIVVSATMAETICDLLDVEELGDVNHVLVEQRESLGNASHVMEPKEHSMMAHSPDAAHVYRVSGEFPYGGPLAVLPVQKVPQLSLGLVPLGPLQPVRSAKPERIPMRLELSFVFQTTRLVLQTTFETNKVDVLDATGHNDTIGGEELVCHAVRTRRAAVVCRQSVPHVKGQL